jgi:predicted nucleotidyltransferase
VFVPHRSVFETTESVDLQDVLGRLCEQYHLVAVYAFGSRATEIAARVHGEPVDSEHPMSDVDIGVLPTRTHPLSLDDKVDLATELEDLFGVERVDLVDLPQAKTYLALDIVCGELLYVTDADEEANYQLYVLRRAADLAPYERERRRMILEGEAI